MFDLNDWICARTITVCESVRNFFFLSTCWWYLTVHFYRHSINSLSFSHDGEYLAIANAGSYVDIVSVNYYCEGRYLMAFQCATETGVPLHRVPALAPSPTVTWHPSKYVVAYCGQTKIKEGGPPPVAVVSMFGLLE